MKSEILPTFSRLSEITKTISRVSFGCDEIDSCLNGGIVSGSLTEICGESSSGKTQTVLRLLLTGQLSSERGSKTLYICSEGSSPIGRLEQIAIEFSQEHGILNHQSLLDNVFVEEVESPEDIWNLVHRRLRILVAAHGVSLIVIDSIAAIFRSEFGSSLTDLTDRKEWLFGLAATMKQYCSEYGCTFVIVNQVSGGTEKGLRPALGMGWSACLDARICLRSDGTRLGDRSEPEQKRIRCVSPELKTLSVLFSNAHALTSTPYVIQSGGIRGIFSGITNVPARDSTALH